MFIFYDWREGWNGAASGPPKTVQAVQIDIAKFNIWLTNSAATNNGISYNTQCKLSSHKSHPIDSIYIYNAVPLTSTTLPAVRVVNGGNVAVADSALWLHRCHGDADVCVGQLQCVKQPRLISQPKQHHLHLACRAHGRRHHHPVRQLE